MIRDLVKVANRLDSLGLQKEADFLDGIIRKIASNEGVGETLKSYMDSLGMGDIYETIMNKIEDKCSALAERVASGLADPERDTIPKPYEIIEYVTSGEEEGANPSIDTLASLEDKHLYHLLEKEITAAYKEAMSYWDE